VTLVASRAHLSPMYVGMAIRALLADIGKYGTGVALCARDALMHAAEGKACLVVIELRHIADRFPSRKRVTVLARYDQRAMWATGGRCAIRLVLRGLRTLHRQQSGYEHYGR
jgi:hypothetical protein